MFRRFAYVRQDDHSDCGAAALATVALHHRIPVGLQAMRDLAGTDRGGTNLLGLADAAKKLGFWAKGVRVDVTALPEVPLPAIAHVTTDRGRGHFVVLHRVRKGSVVIADPAHGILKPSRHEFCRKWTGHLLILAPDPTGSRCSDGRPPTSPFRRYLSLLRFHRWVLCEGCICALVMTLLGISTSFFIQHLVDSVLIRNEVGLLNALGAGMLILLVFRMLLGLVRQYLLAHVARRVDLFLISRYARHVLELPMHFFEMRRVGEILSRVNDAGRVREAISGTALSVIIDGITVVVSVAALWLYDPALALVATAFTPLMVISVMLHHTATKRSSRELMEHSAELSAHLVEDISAVETVKAFGLERTRGEAAESKLVRVVQSAFGLQKLGMSMGSVGIFVTGFAGIVILWYGGHRVMSGVLTLGQLMFFNTLVGYTLGPLERLAGASVQIQEALVALDRLGQIMDLKTEKSTAGAAAPFRRIEEAIEFHDVCFRYGCRENVLERVTLRIPAGATVAIVGESGSGKSTLLKMLMRFHDPMEGKVTIDGVDVRDIGLASLRSRTGLVSQDPFIFNGTIRENIGLGRPRVSMAEVVDAARAAGLEEFIAALPDRYQTVIGERGANLSGGQRQRLAIARALLRKPELVIFDEATSHLDTTTERAIQKSLQALLAGKTAVLVAHRLSTVKDADLIYVLHRGRVVEHGTHGQLLAAQGRYAALWDAQSALPDFGPLPDRLAARVNGHHHQYRR